MFQNDTDIKLAMLAEQSRKASLTDMEPLTELVFDNADLERLESLLDEFNIFEAIGIVRQEIRHSAFLAFLLDPRQPHGLGDILLKRFLQRVVSTAKKSQIPINVIDLDVWNLNGTQVFREWIDIDILLLNEEHKLAIIIENKIDASEHSEQLQRYYEVVSARHHNWNIIGIFLSPYGTAPSDERYLAVSHQLVVELIESVTTARVSTLGPDVQTLLLHYVQMMRRHIVSGSEIDALCRRIYEKHQRALELIFERRPNKQAMLQEELKIMIETTPEIRLRYATKQQFGFHPTEWDVPVLQRGLGTDVPALTLEFYLYNNDNGLKIVLFSQYGSENHRQKLLNMALTNRPLFRAQSRTLNKTANSIYSRQLISSQNLHNLDSTEIMNELHKQWTDFIDFDLKRLQEFVRAEKWIWGDTYVPSADEVSDANQSAAPLVDTSDEL